MFENPGFFRIRPFVFGIRENSKSWMWKSQGKKSTISEVSIWPSRSAELYGRICGGKLGTPGVKWLQLFLMYLHSWSPGVPIYRRRPWYIFEPISRRSVVFVKSQILNQKHSQGNILLFLPFPLCLSATFSYNSIFKLLNKTFSKLKNKKKFTHEYRIKKVILNLWKFLGRHAFIPYRFPRTMFLASRTLFRPRTKWRPLVAFVNELKFCTQKYHWGQKWPLKIRRPPDILILKSLPGKELLTSPNMRKYCPVINQSDIRMSGLRCRNSYVPLLKIICSLGHSFRNEWLLLRFKNQCLKFMNHSVSRPCIGFFSFR